MNKIYKVIWSKAKNCYVVASELAKRHTKSPQCDGLVKAGKLVVATAAVVTGMTTCIGTSTVNAAPEPTFAPVAENQYVALYNTNPGGYTRTSINVTGDPGNPYTYYVANGYNVIGGNYTEYTDLSANGRVFVIVPHKDLSEEMNSTSSIIYSTGKKTNLDEGINSVDPGVFVAATNSGSTLADHAFRYIIYDPGYNGKVASQWYKNGWVDLSAITSGGIDAGFKPVTWNSDLGTYTYKGEVVDFSNVYCLTQGNRNTVGVFLKSDGTVYTGSVYGYNNEILKTARITDYNYATDNTGSYVYNTAITLMSIFIPM